MTIDNGSHRARIHITTGSSITVGLVIFLFGIFLITPVATWLLSAFGWVAMITGTVIFSSGIWTAVRSRA